MNHQDVISGQFRTWPYGTRKKAVFMEVHAREKFNALIVICHEDQEGYVLIQNTDVEIPEPNSQVTIEFTEGGPMGGYWKIV